MTTMRRLGQLALAGMVLCAIWPAQARYISADPIGVEGGANLYGYTSGNPLAFTDPSGLYTEIIIWNGAGIGTSAYGHVSANINGVNHSFGPQGWDSRFPSAAAYAAHQMRFRSGSGTVLDLSGGQEMALEGCLRSSNSPYHLQRNNCGTQIQSCLEAVGAGVGRFVLPAELGRALFDSPAAIGQTHYPGPIRLAPMPIAP